MSWASARSAEARVVLRMSDHDDQRVVGLARAPQALAHQRRPRAAALGRGHDPHGSERKHARARVEPGAAERDVPDHVLTVESDHAEIGLMRLRLPQGVDEIALLSMLTERKPVDAADRREVLRRFGPDL
jgi:hypothetical protein